MPVEIEILDKVITRLETIVDPALGYLYGISYERKILIVGFSFEDPPLTREYSDASLSIKSKKEPSDDEDLASAFMSAAGLASCCSLSSTSSSDRPCSSDSTSSKSIYFDALQAIYPTGIDIIGVLAIKNGVTFDEQEIKHKLKDVYVTNTPPYLEKDSEKDELTLQIVRDGGFYSKCFTILTREQLEQNFCVINLLADISVKLPVRPKPSDKRFSQIQQLAKRVSEEMMFRVGKSDIFLSLNAVFHNLYSSIGKIFDKAQRSKDYRTGLEVVKVYGFFPSVVDVDVKAQIYAPFVIDYKQKPESSTTLVAFDEDSEKFFIDVRIPFDGLCIVHRNRSIRDAYSILIDAAERIIYLAEMYINRLMSFDDAFAIQTLSVHHFFPEDLGHPISFIYVYDDTDAELEDVRKGLHNTFNLPLEKPIFRKGLSLDFRDAKIPPIPLLDVHIGLKPSGLKGPNRKCGIVKGSYEYYHYNLTKSKTEGPDIKDSGWGCAYRSLQTICSWYRLQGYTTLDVPTHRKVQEILVEIGDKSKAFIGSKTWIGSTEVSYALETYLSGVTSVIINLPSGSEMFTMGPVLYDHFRFQGTPVMIGGGVLAHTILGVDYDEETSEIYFLILDPHYVGEDDVAYMQKKGFIAWKGIDFWAKNSFYNLCLPQRPFCF